MARPHQSIGRVSVFATDRGSVAVQGLSDGFLIGLPSLTAAEARRFASALIECADYIEQPAAAVTEGAP